MLLKWSIIEELQKRAEESIIAIAATTAFVKQLQNIANKGVGEAALLKDTQQRQEDNNISDLGDEESSDKDVESINDFWGPIDWPIKLQNTKGRLNIYFIIYIYSFDTFQK